MIGRTGCYPGSFDPLTVGHLAVADAAHRQCELARVDLVLSTVALGKERHRHSLDERVRIIRDATVDRPWLHVVVTGAQLVADIAAGYDVLVVGADKWAQVHDPAFYGGSDLERDRALARLPAIGWAPRDGLPPPDGADGVIVLDLPAWVQQVSATAVRDGRNDWRAVPVTRQSPE